MTAWESLGFNVNHFAELQQRIDELINKDDENVNNQIEFKSNHKKREAGLHVIQKDINKYKGIIADELTVGKGETLVYGASATTGAVNQLADDILPLNDTEKRINGLLARLRGKRREVAAALFPKALGHSVVIARRAERHLRQLWQQEIVDMRRRKAVKSKNVRRRRRKDLEKEKAKLMEQLLQEDPEAAEKLRQEYEVKRAEARMQLGSKARREWAKLARRFGGKSVERTIEEAMASAENQKRLLNKLSGHEKSESCSSESDGEDLSEQPQEGGIWNMPFMRRAEELKNAVDKFDSDAILIPDEAEEVAGFLAAKRKGVSKTEPIPNSEENIEKFLRQKKQQRNKTEAKFVVTDESEFNRGYFDLKQTKSVIVEEPATDKIEENLKDQQDSLIRLAFDLCEDDGAKALKDEIKGEKMAEIEDALEQIQPAVIAGWGNWTGIGIVDKRMLKQDAKRKEIEENAKSEMDSKLAVQGSVKIHPNACKPDDKYLVNQVPYGFRSAAQYVGHLKERIGVQFVPHTLHRERIAPKHEIIRGRVINALKAEKNRS